MPKVDSSITRTSRGHFSLAILIHVIIALHYYAQVGSSQRLPSHTNGYLVTDSRWRACHIIRMVVSLDDWSVTAIVALRHVDDVADSGPSTRSPRPAATRRGTPRSSGKPRRPTTQTLTRTRSTRTRHLSTRSNYIIQNVYVYYIYTLFLLNVSDGTSVCREDLQLLSLLVTSRHHAERRNIIECAAAPRPAHPLPPPPHRPRCGSPNATTTNSFFLLPRTSTWSAGPASSRAGTSRTG